MIHRAKRNIYQMDRDEVIPLRNSIFLKAVPTRRLDAQAFSISHQYHTVTCIKVQ